MSSIYFVSKQRYSSPGIAFELNVLGHKISRITMAKHMKEMFFFCGKFNDVQYFSAVARKDYTERRRRQAEGVLKAKDEGRYKGRPENVELHQKVQGLLDVGKSYSEIQFMLGCSRHTISKVKNRKKSCLNFLLNRKSHKSFFKH